MQKTKARKQGVSKAQMEVLRRMAEHLEHGGAFYPGEVRANASRLLALERRGYVKGEIGILITSPFRFRLTPAGRALVEVSRGTK